MARSDRASQLTKTSLSAALIEPSWAFAHGEQVLLPLFFHGAAILIGLILLFALKASASRRMFTLGYFVMGVVFAWTVVSLSSLPPPVIIGILFLAPLIGLGFGRFATRE